jgi:hypothetical protein
VQKKQFDQLVTTVTGNILIAEAVEEYWGKRCDTFDPDCCCCQAWKAFDRLVRGRHDSAN